ncbi:MAG: FAD-dependent oxidoreductase [Kiritimatiellae bacterium]|nr:FAD-dependent oxidoreductase [Kiritimatiellia bacterium]
MAFGRRVASVVWRLAAAALLLWSGRAGAQRQEGYVAESHRAIPLAYAVDVVVVGGSSGAVAAAAEAARAGARVFLAAPKPYLGEDMCATLQLWLEKGEQPSTRLAKKIFGDAKWTAPLQVKRVLAEELLAANVPFLFGCHATDVIRDSEGHPCGIAMVNRAGRQAVTAKVLIDATDRAWIARMAGAEAYPWAGGVQTCKRVVIGGSPRTGGSLTHRDLRMPRDVAIGRRGKERASATDSDRPVIEYTLRLKLAGGEYASLAKAEQRARDLTYQRDQLRGAENLVWIPPDPIRCRATVQPGTGLENAPATAFQPAGVERVFILSGAADMPRADAQRLMRPCALMAAGTRIGKAAAALAKRPPAPKVVGLTGAKPDRPAAKGQVREGLQGVRAGQQLDSVPQPDRRLPVLARVDVVVIGGGTSGAAAAIGAARQGAKTLVVEYLEGLGGMGTLGLIGRYHFGRNVGFSAETPAAGGEPKMEWWRRAVRKAGGEIWFGALGCGAFVEDGGVRGVIVATPGGRGVVLAKAVVDSTGNADIAVAAGAESLYTDAAQIALQGTGRSIRPLGRPYVNSDDDLVDESDMLDTWRFLTGSQTRKQDAFDVVPIIQSRERRRVVGDYVLTILDQMAERTFPDTVVMSRSNYDSHGYPSHPFFALVARGQDGRPPGGTPYTPYRCLLPRGLDGILVTGTGASAQRDAMALIRMQADLQNQGYAAGVAAAMAARAGVAPRQLDVKRLQRHLVKVGNIPKAVLEHTDSFPLPAAEIAAAVEAAGAGDLSGKTVATILAHAGEALPHLRCAHERAAGDARITYARFLGLLGDAQAVPTLVEAVQAARKWDKAVPLGVMAEFSHLPTWLDSLILALGCTKARSGLDAIRAKAELLDAKGALSHHRAVALALERIAEPAGAAILARLLQKPGMTGHHVTGLGPNPKQRIAPLREIVLARALYRCGDRDGLGERILRNYAGDFRGLFAQHAQAVLDAGRAR